eukprot:1195806-Prorocentrum_minimum.AAC.10
MTASEDRNCDPGVRMIGTVNTQIQPLPKNGRTCPADLTVVTNPPVDYFTLAEATNSRGSLSSPYDSLNNRMASEHPRSRKYMLGSYQPMFLN